MKTIDLCYDGPRISRKKGRKEEIYKLKYIQ
jgi:hypothetical protein